MLLVLKFHVPTLYSWIKTEIQTSLSASWAITDATHLLSKMHDTQKGNYVRFMKVKVT